MAMWQTLGIWHINIMRKHSDLNVSLICSYLGSESVAFTHKTQKQCIWILIYKEYSNTHWNSYKHSRKFVTTVISITQTCIIRVRLVRSRQAMPVWTPRTSHGGFKWLFYSLKKATSGTFSRGFNYIEIICRQYKYRFVF